MKNCPVILILTFLFLFAAQTSAQDWKISDYLKNLPKEFKVFSGDFSSEVSEETTLIDDKNGYAAFYDQPVKYEAAFPIFEMAVFKKANGEQILVVSNSIIDPVCTAYKTFFLQKSGEDWIDVKAKVLPKLPPEIFFDTAKTAQDFIETQKKIGNSTDLDLHFSPPRQGTKMNVKLDICDYVPDDLSGEIDFQKFIDKSKIVLLVWDKKTGSFIFK